MANVYDVAKFIVNSLKEDYVTHMKLHKLLYYSQAWSLVWDEKELFESRIEAWVNGPVVKEVYTKFRGQYSVSIDDFKNSDLEKLEKKEIETIDEVLKVYGNKTSQWLSDLTHQEEPWKKARKGMASNERGSEEITQLSMSEYYEGLSS